MNKDDIREQKRQADINEELIEDQQFINQNNLNASSNLELLEKDIEPHYRDEFRLLNRDIQSGNISAKGQMYIMSVGSYERALTYLMTLKQKIIIRKYYINKDTQEKFFRDELEDVPLLNEQEHILDSPYLRTGLYCDSSLSVGATRRKLSRTMIKEHSTEEKLIEQPKSIVYGKDNNNTPGYI